MSLKKRARSLRRADSASELPLLREVMAAPDGDEQVKQAAHHADEEGEAPPASCALLYTCRESLYSRSGCAGLPAHASIQL